MGTCHPMATLDILALLHGFLNLDSKTFKIDSFKSEQKVNAPEFGLDVRTYKRNMYDIHCTMYMYRVAQKTFDSLVYQTDARFPITFFLIRFRTSHFTVRQ